MAKFREIAQECLQSALEATGQRQRRAYLKLADHCLDLVELDDDEAKTAMLRAEVDAMRRPAN
jgi:hypothetical protein